MFSNTRAFTISLQNAKEKAFCRKECPWQESNLRPSGPQPDALSTELQGHILYCKQEKNIITRRP